MRAEKTRMTHPELPGQEIRVSLSAVPTHQRAGWVVAPERVESEAPGEGGVPDDPKPEPKTSRRTPQRVTEVES